MQKAQKFSKFEDLRHWFHHEELFIDQVLRFQVIQCRDFTARRHQWDCEVQYESGLRIAVVVPVACIAQWSANLLVIAARLLTVRPGSGTDLGGVTCLRAVPVYVYCIL